MNLESSVEHTSRKRYHHYVSQFYLRNFANDSLKRKIGVYVNNYNSFHDSVPIRHQAKAKNFYYHDEVEGGLSKIESEFSKIIKQITINDCLPTQQSEEWILLILFIAVSALRTFKYVEYYQNQAKAIVENINKLSVYSNSNKEQLNIVLKQPFSLWALEASFQMAFYLSNMNICLLINKHDEQLITSDDPVVLYNQYLEKRKHYGGITGIATRGLQLYMPLSPRLALLLYDGDIYMIRKMQNNVALLKNSEDIDEFNRLTCANSDKCLYYSTLTGNYKKTIKKMKKRVKMKEKIEILKESGETRENGARLFRREGSKRGNDRSTLLIGIKDSLKIKLNPKCIVERKRAASKYEEGKLNIRGEHSILKKMWEELQI